LKAENDDLVRVCKVLLFINILLTSVFQIWGINFQDIDLSNDDRLIFRVDYNYRHAVFVSNLNDMSIRQITAFPEKIYLVDNNRTIIALNRFGAVSIPVTGGLPATVSGYPSFAEGSLPLTGRLQDIAPSSDGRWFLFIEPISPGYGNLFLVNITSGSKRIVSERIELPASDFPAKWSVDSRFFVYSKGGRLYYFPILNNLSSLVDERFRMIGHGNINSVLWGPKGDFYYLTGNTLYRIINPELFTRTMYGDFLSIGNAAAVIPIEFNPGFDQFWIAPDSGSILINKGSKGLFFFPLGENNEASSVPYITLPFGAENINVFWSSSGKLTILLNIRGEIKAWRIETAGNSIKTAELANVPSFANGALSPNETRAVFIGDKGLELWDYSEWRLIQKLSDTPVFSCVWLNDRQLIAGNSRFIEEINISVSSYPRRRISLSGADEIGFEETTLRILARLGNTWFATDGNSAWTETGSVRKRQISFASDRFRVFLEPQRQGHFENIPMIRNLQTLTTVSLAAKHTSSRVFTPDTRNPSGEPRLSLPGSSMQIALCFDLYDDDAGLVQVLSALRKNNIRATFFLNGEFIRRNPRAARAIAEAGHETASLFYAPIDFSDTRYRITSAFIGQGLARNEDEFNRITGRELSVIWHPPYYRSSDFINSAAAAAGYVTVNRSIDPNDWLSKEDAASMSMRAPSPSEMIDQIISGRHSGAVVPVRLGLLSGGRDEYLFQYIETLIDALIRADCEVVPVSAVIRR